ncbi:MAG: ComEC/Rec2 family competence protein [Patescibacteria group bacterium]|nr:ComEC/Rec2 family competence protein [Patescibacteria group bacterium]MBU2508899.1 ComEC/Rec2 family competence protein [Patescibacteria group bacterium]
MYLNFPRTVGSAAGWVMLAFVFGVALHSFKLFWHVPSWVWLILFVTFGIGLVSRLSFKSKVVITLLFAFSQGFWRCDIASAPRIRWIEGKAFVFRSDQPKSDFGKQMYEWRKFVTARIQSSIPPKEASLVSGILYGDTDFTKEQRETFISSGLMHIVAVSGSNVTVVVQIVAAAILGLGFRRRHAFYITCVGIFLFVAFVGFEASVMRAAFMGCLILLSREVGRMVSPFRLLLVAATILLLINPWQLVFDVGFALSFLAMWGLLSWAPLFHSWFRRLPKFLGIREIFSTSLAATLMTAPYLGWAFNRMSFAGLFTNVLALPLIIWIMGLGTLAAIWGTLPGSLWVSAPVLGLARTIEKIAELTYLVPWLDVRIYGMQLSTLIATYALIIYLWRQLSRKNDLSTDLHV